MDNYYHYFKRSISEVLTDKGFGNNFTIDDDSDKRINITIRFKKDLNGEQLSYVTEILDVVAYFAKRDLCLKEKPIVNALRLNLFTMKKQFTEDEFDFENS
jgi:hypothetical protein